MLEALGINLWGLIFTIVNFLILIGVLYKFLYKPFLGILDKRKKVIKDNLDSAEETKRLAEEKMQEYLQQIANAQEEGKEIIRNARGKADEQAQLIIEEAHNQADEILAKAEKRIEKEREQAVREMKKEIASLAVLAAEQIVEHEVSAVGQEAIVDKIIEEAGVSKWQS